MKRLTPVREGQIRETLARAINGELAPAWTTITVQTLLGEVDALRAEVEEQCRLNGMGAQRELKLITERDALRADIESIRNDQLYIAAANERDRLRDELALAQSDASIKHKHRADALEKERDRLRELLGDAAGALEDLHFYPCTACEENMEVRDKALAKIREALK